MLQPSGRLAFRTSFYRDESYILYEYGRRTNDGVVGRQLG